jgi:hypothetical protein
MFRKFRIAVLSLILVFVALNTWLDRVYTRDWNGTLQVALYPVNIDGSSVADAFIQQLRTDDLRDLSDFFSLQAADYELPLETPLRFVLAPALTERPPLPPERGSGLGVMWWSLKLRWFTWRTPNPPGPTPIIRIFMLFHDPQRSTVLPHSTGLEKGLVGIVHVFAATSMARTNQVVVAHELLHTLGATDKYDLDTNQPIYPEGYADPDRQPRFPQDAAEIMAGRIPISETEAEQAPSLRQTVIGPSTAREIGWVVAP